MGSSTVLTDPAAQLVADASTIINLIATGCAKEILSALPNQVVVVDAVPGELEAGRKRGRATCDRLNDLVAAGVVGVVALDEKAEPHFEELVIGPAVATLDDGEAATIAFALARASTALIDERALDPTLRGEWFSLRELVPPSMIGWLVSLPSGPRFV